MSGTKKKTYAQKYTAKWESESCFAGWLMKAPPNPDNKQAYCKVCSAFLSAQKKSLLDHFNIAKQKSALIRDKEMVNISKIDVFTKPHLTETRKIAELSLAFFIAEHSLINPVDDLSIVAKKLDSESQVLRDIQLHRSKCASLLKNVLSPCILQELIEDVGDSYFSIIVDESTAIDGKKLLCLVIKYFSVAKENCITTFYRLVEIEAGTANAITNVILSCLKADGLMCRKVFRFSSGWCKC